MSLREKGKARRRGEIIAAAASLWRLHGVGAVSVADVAAAAEVSNQTIYNLVGGVDALMVAVVENLLSRLEQAVSATSEGGVKLTRFGGAIQAFAGGFTDASHSSALLA